ncbi:MAG: UDP-N-acetylmuramoyl-tripeptide--D-alanyl-D-alanine ligase [Pseudomonadales bacterium]|nr:UDP-N-acetylmuramoyl-tripeptide--D-alanyl-D-alanine ligase [Pseudomonadales bacterium]
MILATTFDQLAQLIEGQLSASNPDGHRFNVVIDASTISTDSRVLKPGQLFVALKGPQFDGAHFIDQAIELKALGAIVTQGSLTAELKRSADAHQFPVIEVGNTLTALTQLAELNRAKFTYPVVAVTGSSGKTSVKEMLSAVLGQKQLAFATPGNLNNAIGVPLSVLKLNQQHRIAVLELGASGIGEILHTVSLVRPDIGIITNAGTAHLGEFGGYNNIVSAKGEMIEGVTEGGVIILNYDDPAFEIWCERAAKRHIRIVSFSAKGNDCASIRAKNISTTAQGTVFDIELDSESGSIELDVAGYHNVENALAVTAAALKLGMKLDEVQQGLNGYQGVKGRLQRIECGNLSVIDDSYNANPESIKAALSVLSQCAGYRIAVLGDMAELGADAPELHHSVGQFAAEHSIDYVFSSGQFSTSVLQGVLDGAGCGEAFTTKTELIGALLPRLSEQASEGQVTVLVKGSRSSRMEDIVETITQRKASEAC